MTGRAGGSVPTGGVQAALARWAGRGVIATAVAGALVAVMLVPAGPSAAQVRARTGQQIAAWAREAASDPAPAPTQEAVPQMEATPQEADAERQVWATGVVVPDAGGRVTGGPVSVTFSGHDIADPLDVTVAEVDQHTAATAADGASTAVLTPGFDVTAVTPDGDPVTTFPNDAPDTGTPTFTRRAATTSGSLPVTRDRDGSPLIGGLPIGQAAHPEAANTEVDLDVSMAGDEAEVVPGVRLEVEVDPSALAGISTGSVRLMTRESDAEAWTTVPSYLDVDRSVVVGELDHLSQFVVIGGKDTGDPRPRVVLDPDNDRAFANSPGPRVTEVGYNVELANQVAARLTQTCNADVVVTRPTPIADLGRDIRAGMAYAHNPDLTVTIGFNGNQGTAWGNIGNGGSEVYSRGGALDEQARASVLNVLPVYTGRPATPKSRANLTYSEYAGLPGALIHLETLFLDHNFDRPVIDNGFGFIVDGVFTSLGLQLEAQGFDCSDPNRGGGWPSPPTSAQMSAWMQLGFKNYAAYGGDPVNLATGNLVELEDLFDVTGPGGADTQVALVHNSQDGRVSRFGTGWTSDLTARAQRFTDGSVMVVRGDGASFAFGPNGVGGYTTDANTGATLAEVGAGQLLLTVDDGTTWRFDASHPEGVGDVVERVDATGAVTRYEYGALDGDPMFRPLTAVVLPGEQRIAVTSDARGIVTGLTAPDGGVWQLGYDDALDLRTITLPDGRVRSFDYDGAHRLTVARDAAGSVFLTNTYDDAGRVTSQGDGVGGTRTFAYRDGRVDYTDAAGSVWSYQVDGRSRITAVTDPLGQVTRTEYGALDAPTADVAADGSRTEYTLDAKGRPTRITGPDGATTSYVLDDLGRVVRASEPGNHADSPLVTVLDRDDAGRITRIEGAGGTVEVTAYDPAGNPTAVTDPSGAVWSASFDERGNQLTSTDPLGRTTTFAYDLGNRLTSRTLPSGATWSYGYDAAGRLTSETDPSGAVTGYGYDANDNLTTVTDPSGATTAQEWDTGRRLTTVTDPAGAATRYTYDPEDTLLAETDPTGAVTSYTLDAAHRVTAVTDPNGGLWRRTLDPMGRVVAQADPDGGVSTWEYDAAGRVIVETDPDGVTTGYAYTPAGQIAELRDSAGQVSTFSYDASGLLAAATGPDGTTVTQDRDALGRVVRTTDQAGNAATVTYDQAGQVVAEADRTGASTTFEYDVDGQLVATTDADGVRRTTSYDRSGRILTERIEGGAAWTFGYDPAGRLTSETNGRGAVWSYSYDPSGRMIRTTDPTGAVTGYSYDAAGRQRSTTDADGVRTDYRYDPAGQLTAVVQNATASDADSAEENVTTAYAYTATGNLAQVTGPTGAVTSYAYTDAGRLASETDALGNAWRYTYDPAGRLAAQTDPDGRVTRSRYDPAGRTTQVSYTQPGVDPVTVRLEYDPTGHPVVMTDASGTTGWTYDAEGRQTAQRTTAGTLTTTYTAAGRQATLTTPDQVTQEWRYDSAGQVSEQTTPAGVLAYTYDRAGQVTTTTRTNSDGSPGPASAYAYDLVGRTTQVGHRVTEPASVAPTPPGDVSTTCDTCLPGADYLAGRTLPGTGTTGSGVWDILIDQTYTPTGHVASSTRVDTGGRTQVGAYRYDPLGRLTGGTLTDQVSTLPTATGPDVADSEQPVTTVSYTYDASGNRTSATTAAPDGRVTTQRGRYDDAGRLTLSTVAVTDSSTSDLLAADVESTRYSYDRAGHRTVETTGALPHATVRTYAYGADGLVARISDDERTVSFTRDGLGRAATTTTSTEFVTHTTANTWDGLTQVAASDDTFGATTYTRDVLGDLAVQASARSGGTAPAGGVTPGAVWELTDPLGSLIAQAAGDTITQVAWYDPWGAQDTTITAGWDADHGYTSQLSDPGLGEVLFYARTYDPVTGQFTSADPWAGLLAEPGTLTSYAYVLDDPLSVTDVLGYWPDWNAVGGWISDHKREITGVAAGVVVGLAVGACIAATAGLCAGVAAGVATAAGSGGLAGIGAAVTIGAASGAAGGATSYAVTGDGGQYSWGGAARSVGVGALVGGVTGGLGYGVTSALRGVGNRLTAAHQNSIATARNTGARFGSTKPNGNTVLAGRPASQSRRPSVAAGARSPAAAAQARAIRSLEARVREHVTKLAAYRQNPWAFDNKGHLAKAPSERVRQSIIQGRIRHLEHEIATFRSQIEALRE